MNSAYTVPLVTGSFPVRGWPEVRDFPCLLQGRCHRADTGTEKLSRGDLRVRAFLQHRQAKDLQNSLLINLQVRIRFSPLPDPIGI